MGGDRETGEREASWKGRIMIPFEDIGRVVVPFARVNYARTDVTALLRTRLAACIGFLVIPTRSYLFYR
jgi:hypothetical protein